MRMRIFLYLTKLRWVLNYLYRWIGKQRSLWKRKLIKQQDRIENLSKVKEFIEFCDDATLYRETEWSLKNGLKSYIITHSNAFRKKELVKNKRKRKLNYYLYHKCWLWHKTFTITDSVFFSTEMRRGSRSSQSTGLIPSKASRQKLPAKKGDTFPYLSILNPQHT